jgi:hypothetical protein
MSLEATDIEKQVTDLLETPFEQPEFEMPLGNLISKKAILNATGSALSGSIAGFIPAQFSAMIPFGLAPVIAGIALKKTIAKTGVIADVADGVIMGGLATVIAPFVSGIVPQAQITQQEDKEEKIDGVMW